jgi:two-component system response regulator VicR
MVLKKILIVEDEPLMLKFLEFRLTKAGYDVQTAKDGNEAEEWINTEDFSLIIIDLMIPFVSGFELLAKKTDSIKNKHTPVLIISSYTQENIISESLSLGAEAFLPKPIDVDDLTATVKTLLDKYKIAV